MGVSVFFSKVKTHGVGFPNVLQRERVLEMSKGSQNGDKNWGPRTKNTGIRNTWVAWRKEVSGT